MIDAELEEIRVLRSVGRHDDYLDGARALADAHPDHVAAQIEAAYACDRFGREADAIGYYDAAWRLGVPADRRDGFLLGYGSTLRNVGRIDEAVALLSSAVTERPEHAPLQAFLALALHSAGRHGQAMATLLGTLLQVCHESGALGAYDRALREYREQLLAE